MPYAVVFTSAGARDVRRLPRPTLAQVHARLQGFAHDPRPRGVEPVRGSPGVWRLRVGDYRILYTIDDAQHVVTIARVRHRHDVYRGL